MEYEVEGQLFRVKHAVGPCPPGFEQTHRHPCFELFLFLSGDADFCVGSKCYRLVPNSLLVIPPGYPHHIVLTGKKHTYERIALWFRRELLDWELWEQLLSLGPSYSLTNANVLGEFHRLDHIYQSMDPCFLADAMPQAIRQTLYFLLSSPGTSTAQPPGNWEQITAYIDDNLTSIRTMEDLCNQLHMSRSSLHKLFAAHAGTSVMAYIRERRCQMAQLLLQSGLSPNEVFPLCGYQDYSTFYRSISAQFGCCPSELGKR